MVKEMHRNSVHFLVMGSGTQQWSIYVGKTAKPNPVKPNPVNGRTSGASSCFLRKSGNSLKSRPSPRFFSEARKGIPVPDDSRSEICAPPKSPGEDFSTPLMKKWEREQRKPGDTGSQNSFFRESGLAMESFLRDPELLC